MVIQHTLMVKFTYLFINLFTIAIPLGRSFEPRIGFYKKWRFYIPALLITAVFFLVWDYLKIQHGVWMFNPNYITGINLYGIPIEEILFFITVPYACTFIYETIGHFVKGISIPHAVRKALLVLCVAAFAVSFSLFVKAYTFSVLFIGGPVIGLATILLPEKAFNNFLLTYLISLLPMAVVNGLLTALPIVIYNNAENSGVRIGTIPVEDFLYCAILLCMNIALYEWQKYKGNSSFRIITPLGARIT